MRRLPHPIASVFMLTLLGTTNAKGQDASPSSPAAPMIRGDQRVVIVMIDGFGKDYLEASEMPDLKRLMARGFAKTVRGVMPSVTNANNASIACGVWPEEHGITGNSFFDEAKGTAEYMEDSAYLRSADAFRARGARGVKSALLTAKKKTVALLSRGTDVAIAAEAPSADEVSRYGPLPADLQPRDQLLALGGRDRPAQESTRDPPPVCPHDRLPDAYLAAVGPGVQGTPAADRRADRPGRGRRARCGLPDHGRPWHERQDPLLGPGQGVQESRPGPPVRPVGRARQVRETSSDLRRDGLGLAEARPRTPPAPPRSSEASRESRPY